LLVIAAKPLQMPQNPVSHKNPFLFNKFPVTLFKFPVTLLITLFTGSIFFAACKKESSPEISNPILDQTTSSVDDNTSISAQAASAIAYEGFGSQATGGANSSTVYHVTNISPSGTGSLKNGIGSNKTIVFDVSGTISAGFVISNTSYLTIDGSGQSVTIINSGGDGISFDGANSHHNIIKNIRTVNCGGDGINVVDGAHDIMITNCTAYNNGDGNIDVGADNSGQTKNVTLQYSIIGPHSGDQVGGTLVTAQSVSVHHNLYTPASPNLEGERCPIVHANYAPVGSPNADIRNNIIWKFGRNSGTGSGYGTAICYNATANVINNYYYSAGTTPSKAVNTDDGYGTGGTGKAYVSGNVSGNNGVNANSANNHAIYAIASQYAVTTQDACSAASLVLANAGARPLTSADQSLVSAVTMPNCSVTPPPTNQSPTVNAGTDKTITLPTNSVTLTGTASDPDGTIASYLWTKVSGTGGTITTSNAASTTVTGLTAGTYVFNLKVTDNGGATASDNITVTVNTTTTNQVPTVNAGADKTITLPANSTTLTGTASDPDGTIASYLWTKVSGSGGTITTSNAASTTVTGLTAGSYVFNLKVTDNAGATASDNITVIVNTATTNQVPTVNAGADQTITLPINSATLTGTASDPDGTIASYLWTKVSGSGGSISTANAASTTVTGLTAGSYVFNLRVTDNTGTIASDNITITVNSASQGGGTGYGTLTYSEGYDVSSSVNTSQGIRNSQSTTRYLTGPGSFRSEVRAGDAGAQSEMAYTSSTQNPAEGVVEYDVYYENWSSSYDGGGHSIEWLPNASSPNGAIVSLQNYAGKFKVVRAIGSTVSYQSGTLMTCASNTWYKMRWEYKWSTSTNGYIRLYINNVLYYSYTGKTADGSGQSLRMGQLRWPSGSGNSVQTTSVCYYDNLKIYTK
jgi:hypothetical protein